MDEESASTAVFYGDKRAGTLRRLESGYEFVYSASYLTDPEALPISLTMPLEVKRYESATLFPFFEGLIPEGWLLDLTTTALKIDKDDKFGLLLHTGKDTIGAVTVKPLAREGLL